MSDLPTIALPVDPSALEVAASEALNQLSDRQRAAMSHHGEPAPSKASSLATSVTSWAEVARRLIRGPQTEPALIAHGLARLLGLGPDRPTFVLEGDQELDAPTIVPGHLRVRGAMRITSALWVLGELRCEGPLRDCGPDSHIVVLGDLVAPGVWASGEIGVYGALRASVVEGHHNDNSLVVAGDLEARILFEEEHDVSVYGAIRATLHAALDMNRADQHDVVAERLPSEYVVNGELDLDAVAKAFARDRDPLLETPRVLEAPLPEALARALADPASANTLDLVRTRLYALPPEIETLTHTRELRLDHTRIKTVPSAVTRMRALSILSLRESTCRDLAGLAGHGKLERLDAYGTPLSDLSFARTLPCLSKLVAAYVPVEDLSPLERHPALESLVIGGSRVRDLSVLTTLPKLTELGAFSLPLEDLTAIMDTHLSDLSVSVSRGGEHDPPTALTMEHVLAFKDQNPQCSVLVYVGHGRTVRV